MKANTEGNLTTLKSRVISLVTLLTTFSALVIGASSLAQAETTETEKPATTVDRVVAAGANKFLNSIGVNSAVTSRGEDLQETLNAINYTGIRWIRTGYEANAKITDLIALHQQSGVRFSYGLLSGGTDIARLVKDGRQLAAAGALLALEGSNEPNNWAIDYQGQKGGGRDLSWIPVAQLQKDLYQTVKADPDLKEVPVWHLTENGAENDNVGLQYLVIPEGADTLMPDGTKYADFANVHNYIIHPSHPNLADNQSWSAADPGPESRVSSLYEHYGKTWKNAYKGYSLAELESLPRVTTETGILIGGEVTEEKHARLIVNMYLSQFKRGWSHTAVYLLKDRPDEAGNQKFGFYKSGYVPRKAAEYLHNLTHILADNKDTVQSEALEYAIPNQPDTVHDLLLQKSNGNFELVVWGDKVSGSEEITVKFGQRHNELRIYDITTGSEAVKILKDVDSVTLTLTDYPMIIEIL